MAEPSAKQARLVTLHYRIALADGTEVLSTFGGTPATLALGSGELAPGLERCLEAMLAQGPGARRVFQLEPEEAFGEHRAALVQTMPRSAFDASIALEAGAAVEFSSPDGARHVGLVRSLDARNVEVDFNHPLAGRRVRFEAELIALL
ncbi:MAG TPA: FKBP-type peptidyl-prolyl cis-trans isomerase [Burkholderiales bacterium]|nr:FKBP-type peptidyl-prolyl cis-trans isomerase [Burkholderiales bacterium]